MEAGKPNGDVLFYAPLDAPRTVGIEENMREISCALAGEDTNRSGEAAG